MKNHAYLLWEQLLKKSNNNDQNTNIKHPQTKQLVIFLGEMKQAQGI